MTWSVGLQERLAHSKAHARYRMTHLSLALRSRLLLPSERALEEPDPERAVPFAAFARSLRNWRTVSKKAFSTLVLSLADVSMKSQPISLASAEPSCVETSRSVLRSILLATSMTGAGPAGTAEAAMGTEVPGKLGGDEAADSLTRRICLWKLRMREKEARELML